MYYTRYKYNYVALEPSLDWSFKVDPINLELSNLAKNVSVVPPNSQIKILDKLYHVFMIGHTNMTTNRDYTYIYRLC